MFMKVDFQQVDVFTTKPFKGNPVAVIHNVDGLSTEIMQAIANWTNLSETTFVCKADHPLADYKLRIFTPHSELPFAGHPTIGSVAAVMERGLKPKQEGRIIQECQRGLVTIIQEDDRFFFELPEPKVEHVDEEIVQHIAEAIGVSNEYIEDRLIIDVGPVWLTLKINRDVNIKRLRPVMNQLMKAIPSGITGVTIFGDSCNVDSLFEVRSFAPGEGVPEDPVCGSGNGAVATIVRKMALPVTEFSTSQGSCVGRDGKVDIRYRDGHILIGGRTVTCIEGKLTV